MPSPAKAKTRKPEAPRRGNGAAENDTQVEAVTEDDSVESNDVETETVTAQLELDNHSIEAEAERARKAIRNAEADTIRLTSEIRKLGRQIGISDDEIANAIQNCTTLEAAKAHFLDVMNTPGNGSSGVSEAPEVKITETFAIQNKDRERDVTIESLSAGLALRENLRPFVIDASEARLNRSGFETTGKRREAQELAANMAQDNGIDRMTLRDIAFECIRLEAAQTGRKFGNMSRFSDKLMEVAFTTTTLPTLLGNTQNKSLIQGMMENDSTAMRWIGRKSVNDFKANTVIGIGESDDLVEVGAAGELQMNTPTEATDTHQAKTFGRRAVFTRKDFINDDLGGLMQFAYNQGAAANRLVDSKTYLLVNNGTATTYGSVGEDSLALFSASHVSANYFSGADTALDDASLAEAAQLLLQMKGINGNAKMSLTGRYLIVPAALKHTADILVGSQFVASGTDGRIGTKNPHFGLYEVIAEPLLDDTSSTAWYLAANQQGIGMSIVGSFLNGRTAPYMQFYGQTSMPGYLVGLAWDFWFDFNADIVGFRGIVASKGAA